MTVCAAGLSAAGCLMCSGELTSLCMRQWQFVSQRSNTRPLAVVPLAFLVLCPLLHPPRSTHTGMYYLRTRAAADAIKFTVDQQSLAANQQPAAAQQLMSPSRAPPPALQQQPAGSRAGSRLTSPLKQPHPAAAAAQGLVDSMDGMTMEEREAQLAKMICSLENKDACLMCGS